MSWYIEATYACFLAEIEEEQEREEKMRCTLSSKQGTLQIRYMMIITLMELDHWIIIIIIITNFYTGLKPISV